MLQSTSERAGLRVRVVPERRAGGPAWVVVLCHGYGAPGADLVGLAPELARVNPRTAQEVRFVFPEAPLSLGPVGWGEGRAWWPIDVNRFAAVSQRGSGGGLALLRRELPEALPRMRKAVTALVEEVARAAGVPLSRVVLGGFSQGAMVATDVALHLPEPPAALAAFSGTLIAESVWTPRAHEGKGLPALVTHGRDDPILPYENAVALRDLLQAAGWDVQFLPFSGGHTIPPEALSRFAALLDALT